jgi:DNA-binding CsgD family transcriptional regulator
MRRGQSQADIARALEIAPGSISGALSAAAKRFDVTLISELLALDEVQRQLDAED